MSEQSEPGDVGRAANATPGSDLGRHAIEPQHASNGTVEHVGARLVVLARRCDDAGAERLGEEQPVAGTEPALDEDPIGMDPSRHAESVLRLVVHDRVATGDDPAGLGDLVGAAAEDLGDDRLWHVSREAGHGEREHHLAPHRVDVRHGVGGGDRAPRVRVVHYRREEIDRLHDRHVGTDPVDGRVVGALEPDEQVRVAGVVGGLDAGEHLLEISRSHLGSSAGARGVRGEPDLLAARRRVGHDAVKTRAKRLAIPRSRRRPGPAASGSGRGWSRDRRTG